MKKSSFEIDVVAHQVLVKEFGEESSPQNVHFFTLLNYFTDTQNVLAIHSQAERLEISIKDQNINQ
jgi:hypothetical protein